MRKGKQLSVLLIVFVAMVLCLSATNDAFAAITKPTVMTKPADVITTGATFQGEIFSTGGANITDHGFCYGTSASSQPYSVSLGSRGSVIGSFSRQIGLTSNVTYYYKAYATNSSGTSYGAVMCFTTKPTQGSIPNTLIVTPTFIVPPISGGTYIVYVASNTSWKVVPSAPWMMVSTYGGSGSSFFSVWVAANTSSTRSGSIAVTTTAASNIVTQSIMINQAGITPALTVSPTSIAPVASGGTYTVTVTSNTSWMVTPSAPWLTVNKYFGMGNDTFTVTAAANTTSSSRNATITVTTTTASTNVTQNITVNQEAPGGGAPNITTASLPGGNVNTAYTATLNATGATPMFWMISGGSLPTGLSLNVNTGVISGTPTAAGTFNFTVQVINTVGATTKPLSIVISSTGTPPTTSLTGYVGTPFSHQFEAPASFTPPISWGYGGDVPPGLSFNASGLLSGTPTTTGTFVVYVAAFDIMLNSDITVQTIIIETSPDGGESAMASTEENVSMLQNVGYDAVNSSEAEDNSGGCNAGYGSLALALLGVVPLAFRKRK